MRSLLFSDVLTLFSWTSPLSDRKVSNIAALVYRHDNFSRNDFALKVDAV